MVSKLPRQITNEDRYDQKLDGKLSSQTFYWAVGIIVTLLGGLFIFFIGRIDKVNDSINDLSNRATKIETKLEIMKK